MTKPDASARCVPAADLTAYAHGELPEARRAEISRHLLRCAKCRGEAGAAEGLLERLRAFGAGGEDWRAEIAAAGAEVRAGRRRVLRAGAVALVAATLVAALLLRPGPAASPRGGGVAEVAALFPEIGATLLPEDESALLQAQQLDGRWSAGGGRRDEAATSLAVAALAGRYGKDLADDTVGQAVRSGVEWLLARQGAAASHAEVRPATGDDAPAAPEASVVRIGQDGAEAGAAHALATI